MISLKNVTKKYDDKTVLENFSFDFPENGFVCITGPSGAGKSTLIKIIMGLVSPDSGIINSSENISVVFQDDRLLPERNALFNAALAGSNPDKAAGILSELGLPDDMSVSVKDLSGGMSRRVAIARSLAVNADVYIMDEPLNNLDSGTRKQVLDVIRKYTVKSKKLLIMVTHDADSMEEANKIIDLTH